MENSTQKKTGNPGRDAGLKEKITSSAKVSTMHSGQSSPIIGASQGKGPHIPHTPDSLHRDDSQAGKPICKFDQALIALGSSREQLIQQCMDMHEFARSQAKRYGDASRSAYGLAGFIRTNPKMEDPNIAELMLGVIGERLVDLGWLSAIVRKEKLDRASAQTTAATPKEEGLDA